MDAIDTKLLSALIVKSRTPVTQLAKSARVSREVATYRLNRLIKKEIIQKFITHIDISKLGFVGGALFVNIKPAREDEFTKYLQRSSFISWVAQWTGKWSYGMSIIGKTNEEVDQRFRELYNKFKEDIVTHRFAFHKKNHFFHEKFLAVKKKGARIQKTETNIDAIDKQILKELSSNARVDYVTLAKRVPLTAQGIRQRIKRLEREGVIESYSIFLDLKQLGLQQHSIFADIRKCERSKLIAHLKAHPTISFVAEYLGDPFLEFGLFVKNPYELRPLLKEIEKEFDSIEINEVNLFEEKIASIGPPPCVFN